MILRNIHSFKRLLYNFDMVALFLEKILSDSLYLGYNTIHHEVFNDMENDFDWIWDIISLFSDKKY